MLEKLEDGCGKRDRGDATLILKQGEDEYVIWYSFFYKKFFYKNYG
jgi:hypothetical protein